MSFQFSPETIVLQFEEEINKQSGIISTQSGIAQEIKDFTDPLIEERAILKPKSTTCVDCNCIHRSWWPASTVRCSSCCTVVQNQQIRIDEITDEITGFVDGRTPNILITAAQKELERLQEAKEPFQIEADVRADQIAQAKAASDAIALANRKQKEKIAIGAGIVGAVIIGAKVLL